MLMSVLQENTTAVLMQSAITPRDRTTVRVNLDILEMDGLANVNETKTLVSLKNKVMESKKKKIIKLVMS